MVQIEGKYQFVSSENFKEYLLKRGVPQDRVNVPDEPKQNLDVSVNGNEIKLVSDFRNYTVRILIDGEVEEEIPGLGVSVKSATKQDNVIKVVSKTPDGKPLGTTTYNFTDSGLETVHTLPDNFTAKRVFKRL